MNDKLPVLLLVCAMAAGLIYWARLAVRRLNQKMADAEKNFEREVFMELASASKKHPDRRRDAPPVASLPPQAVQPEAPEPVAEPTTVAPAPAPVPPSAAEPNSTPGFSPGPWEQKLEVAGLLASSGEDMAVAGLEQRCRLLRLKNFKRMVLVPENCPAERIDALLQNYEYVVLTGATRARVLRRFEDFLADQLFR